MNRILELMALAAFALAATTVQAQDSSASSAAPDIVLGIEEGTVLVSSGDEFTQAASGQAVEPGQRVLISEGASATLTYDNGCLKLLSTPGVYTVNADCETAGAVAGRSSVGVIAGVVGGVAVIAAAAGGGGGSDPPPPVSR